MLQTSPSQSQKASFLWQNNTKTIQPNTQYYRKDAQALSHGIAWCKGNPTHYLPNSGSVVYPTWLLMMRWIVPPMVKCGTLASENVSGTIPLAHTDTCWFWYWHSNYTGVCLAVFLGWLFGKRVIPVNVKVNICSTFLQQSSNVLMSPAPNYGMNCHPTLPLQCQLSVSDYVWKLLFCHLHPDLLIWYFTTDTLLL